MAAFTEARGPDTPDELWVVEHPPTFTQGLAGKADHAVQPRGPDPSRWCKPTEGAGHLSRPFWQVVAYPLVDLNRQGI